MFVAEGPKMASELLNSTFEIEHIYAVKKFLDNHSTGSHTVTEVSEIELQKISNLTHANQVVVVAKQQKLQEDPLIEGELTLVLDAVQDPGNFGTIIRIADWFGIKQVVCTVDCVELYNPKVVQATMGSFCRVNVWSINVSQWIKDATIPIYGAFLQGENIYRQQNIHEGIVVIGNEGKGISEELKSFITHPITIPKIGGAESLNAAVATGIIIGCLRNN